MCLACAVPVRGRTLGSECLATALGTEAPAPEVADREPGAPHRAVALVGLVLAAAATVLPWSRFGPGSGPFGAWSGDPLWSMVPAVSAAVGVALAATRAFARGRPLAWDVVCLAIGLLVVAGSILALARPPAFAAPWLGPWIALAGGLITAGGSLVGLRRASEREPANV
jgi:asparagine N-glycosylation enzyme membrane subunit Stt3